MTTTPFTPENLDVEKRAVSILIKTLERYGYNATLCKMPEFISRMNFTPEQAAQFAEYMGDKFDIVATSKDKQMMFLVEAKGKTREAYKNIVNQVDYDKYYELARVHPFAYFVVALDTERIFTHTVRNPQAEPRFKTKPMRGKPVYLIPENEIRLIRPEWLKGLDAWFSASGLLLEWPDKKKKRASVTNDYTVNL